MLDEDEVRVWEQLHHFLLSIFAMYLIIKSWRALIIFQTSAEKNNSSMRYYIWECLANAAQRVAKEANPVCWSPLRSSQTWTPLTFSTPLAHFSSSNGRKSHCTTWRTQKTRRMHPRLIEMGTRYSSFYSATSLIQMLEDFTMGLDTRVYDDLPLGTAFNVPI